MAGGEAGDDVEAVGAVIVVVALVPRAAVVAGFDPDVVAVADLGGDGEGAAGLAAG